MTKIITLTPGKFKNQVNFTSFLTLHVAFHLKFSEVRKKHENIFAFTTNIETATKSKSYLATRKKKFSQSRRMEIINHFLKHSRAAHLTHARQVLKLLKEIPRKKKYTVNNKNSQRASNHRGWGVKKISGM